ncbi:MAG: protein kinase domain-containing protein [Caldilinea sp.]
MSIEKRKFRGRKNEFTEIDYLGGGQTAAVYRVRRERDSTEWALKLLTEPILKTRFFAEVETLHSLRLHTDYNNGKERHNLVPEVVDMQEDGPDQFFVMTLARGTRLDELMRDRERFAEPKALSILAQTAHAFRALHEVLRRDYHDFQPRNIYWEEENDKVLVIDWNLLSTESDLDVANDVLTLGTLLYRLLVGLPLPAAGVTAAKGWGELTVGAQAILRRATHQIPYLRYKNMSEFGDDIAKQLQLWTKDVGDLLNSGIDAFDRSKAVDPTPTRETIRKRQHDMDGARNYFRILEQRERELTSSHRPRFQKTNADVKGTRETSALLRTGRELLFANDSGEARKTFGDIISATNDAAEQLQAIRWSFACVVDAPSRSAMVEACDLVDAGQLQNAREKLEGAQNLREHKAITILLDHVRAQLVWETASGLLATAQQANDPESYKRAAETLLELQILLEKLSSKDQQELYAMLWGDISKAKDDANAAAKRLNLARASVDGIRQMYARLAPNAAVTELQKHLRDSSRVIPQSTLATLGLDLARGWLAAVAAGEIPSATVATPVASTAGGLAKTAPLLAEQDQPSVAQSDASYQPVAGSGTANRSWDLAYG